MASTDAAKPQRVVVDPNGELCLTVGGENAVAFVVCAKTLARASPVLRTLLYGGFAESVQPDRSSGEEWTVELPEDNPGLMEILLNIMHCLFDRVPLSLDAKSDVGPPQTDRPALRGYLRPVELYSLTVLTDKYDLTRILRPWVRSWMDGVADAGPPKDSLAWRGELDMDQAAWVSWELGDKNMFKRTLKFMILNCAIDPEGRLLCYRVSSLFSRALFSDSLEPPDISDLVKRSRLAAIENMLKPIRDVLECLMQGTTSTKRLCSQARGSRGFVDDSQKIDCEITMLGAVIRSLTSHDMWPIPKPEDVQLSVQDMANKLLSLDLRSRAYYHSCSALPEFKETIARGLDSVCPPLVGSHVHHLEAQAEKTGLAIAHEQP
ncbi:hypothetical protein GGS23DRAFT_579437 [Durotheca rogersii]|uniref:uncharacterized protein n=1 Tax=Durotheca rogersii TaxID=419775 RepID=UPI0022210F52|nr:uncharacterized protein GGS23DRAFT_579437 [Durotheca rogersii]KAI5860902.1 hypothetical protein GGS23DRAFT_579437 [Durotheca rogersii]